MTYKNATPLSAPKGIRIELDKKKHFVIHEPLGLNYIHSYRVIPSSNGVVVKGYEDNVVYNIGSDDKAKIIDVCNETIRKRNSGGQRVFASAAKAILNAMTIDDAVSQSGTEVEA